MSLQPLNRLQIAWRAAQDITDGMLVNLGLGQMHGQHPATSLLVACARNWEADVLSPAKKPTSFCRFPLSCPGNGCTTSGCHAPLPHSKRKFDDFV